MRLYWNGTDITGKCEITGCVYRDAAGGRSDSLELQMDHAAVWYRWGPEEGDIIEVTEGNYTTGILYLTAVIPQRDQYRILAGSVNPAGNRKTWGSFRNVSFKALVERCATECGLTGKVFTEGGNIVIPYALRKGEGCAAFLNRIAAAEGFKVKAYNGSLRAIELTYAQGMEPSFRMELTDKQEGVIYRRRDNMKYTALTVRSPFASAKAKDIAAKGNNERVITTLPAENNMQAGRWARNLLREHNQKAEELTVDSRLNTMLGALNRVHVEGGTDMDGEWIVEEAEHDLFNKTTSAKMYRTIESVR